MLPAGEGKVVNVGSSAGSRGRPNQAAYAASKAGIDGLTKALAVEWAPSGIQVNCIAPGHLYTPMVAKNMTDEMRDLRRRAGPLGTEGNAWDIAWVNVFLRFVVCDLLR
mgnify:CR=1 FL=1